MRQVRSKMASFFDRVVDITKNALKTSAQLNKDSEVLFNVIERRIKKTIKDAAEGGRTVVEFDLDNTGYIDTCSKYAMKELLFYKIASDYVPVADRLVSSPAFVGFNINRDKNVFIFDWTHALVKKENTDTDTKVGPKVVPKVSKVAPEPIDKNEIRYTNPVSDTYTNPFANPFANQYTSTWDTYGVDNNELERLLNILLPRVPQDTV